MTQLFALILFAILMYIVIVSFFKRFFALSPQSEQVLILTLLKGMFFPFKYFIGNIYGLFHLEGFLGSRERKKLLSCSNKGLLIDLNKSLRLSEEHSYMNLLIHAVTGGGKTSSLIVPMILDKATTYRKNSMFILDPKGEILSIVGGFLQRRGYKVLVLDPNNLSLSLGFNPLEFVKNTADVEYIMRSLLMSSTNSSSSGQDRFWNESAIALLSLIGNLLVAIGDKQYINLPNVKYLLNNFAHNSADIDNLVIKYASADLTMEYRQFKSFDDPVKLSILATAGMALAPIANNESLKRIMSSPSFDFKRMRTEKIALFMSIPVQQSSQYNFLVSSFISSMMYNGIIDEMPKKNENSIYLFLDEIGSFKIHDLDKYLVVTRGYRVSAVLAIQSVNQVKNLYGQAASEVILEGGIANKVFFGGASNNLTREISSMIGKKQTLIQGRAVLQDVMQASEVRTLKRGEVLVFLQSAKPFIQKITPYFKHSKFKRATKAKLRSQKTRHIVDYVKYIDLQGAI